VVILRKQFEKSVNLLEILFLATTFRPLLFHTVQTQCITKHHKQFFGDFDNWLFLQIECEGRFILILVVNLIIRARAFYLRPWYYEAIRTLVREEHPRYQEAEVH
jgi:hypothetical protein